ncbi:hypothetical protein IPL68_07485 [Candidatus Saccharibacteria bacterium]|nr:MAG: hypothetical protein IPL68_07485 [Candidatus Saccharibacteria bacterium]
MQRLVGYHLKVHHKPRLYGFITIVIAVIILAGYGSTRYYQSRLTNDSPTIPAASKKLAVSEDSVKETALPASEVPESIPSPSSTTARNPQTTPRPASSAPIRTPDTILASGISYATLNHSQYCDGTGTGTVEYITSVSFGLNGMAAQSTELTYIIETQNGTHNEISYPLKVTVPSGSYGATATSSMPGPNALLVFTFYEFDKPGAIRVRTTTPFGYIGSWQPLNKACG